MVQAPAGGGAQFPRYSGTYSGGYQMQNLLSVAEFLVSNGYSRTAAAGIAGAIAGESSGDPEAVGTGGAGLIGWTPPSKAAPDYPIVTGNTQADFDAQLTDLLEYNNTNGPVRQLKSLSGDPVAASKFYSERFERPAVLYSDVRANVAQSIYSQLGGYKSDAAYTQYSGGGVSPNVGKGLSSSNSGPGFGSVFRDILTGFGVDLGQSDVQAYNTAGQIDSLGGIAASIGALAAPFVKMAQALDWFVQPNHWIRIFCGIGGSVLFGVGVWNLAHVGGPAAKITELGVTVPASTGGTLALPIGVLGVGMGGGLLFVAFHNLPASVKTFPDFLAYLQAEVHKTPSKAPEPVAA